MTREDLYEKTGGKAKEFGNFAADEEYEPTDEESIKEVGF